MKKKLTAAAFRARRTERGSAQPQDPFERFYVRWRNGEKLATLAAESGIKRSKFRRLCIAKSGGKAQFATQRAAGAGGRAERGANLRGVSRPRVDDSKLKYLKHGGWTVRRVWVPKTVRIKTDQGQATVGWRECTAMIFVSPKGNEYVRAQAGEPADALIRGQHSLPDTRLRRYTDSRLAKKVETATAEAERHAAAVKRVQRSDAERRTARRLARKGRARK